MGLSSKVYNFSATVMSAYDDSVTKSRGKLAEVSKGAAEYTVKCHGWVNLSMKGRDDVMLDTVMDG